MDFAAYEQGGANAHPGADLHPGVFLHPGANTAHEHGFRYLYVERKILGGLSLVKL